MPTDFSTCAERAFTHAAHLAEKYEATLHVLNVRPPHKADPNDPMDFFPLEQEDAITWSDAYAPASRAYDVPAIHAQVRVVSPAVGILDYADRHDVDLIVMGAHGGRGLRRMLLGSVAKETVRQAPCPVLTVRAPEDPAGAGRVQRVLAAVDFSPFVSVVLRYAKELAALYEAQLDLLHVVEPARRLEFYDTGLRALHNLEVKLEAEARQELRWLYEETEGPDVPASFCTRVGYPSHEIFSFAVAHGTDLIVVSTHGRTGLNRYPIGSVAGASCVQRPAPSSSPSPSGSRSSRRWMRWGWSTEPEFTITQPFSWR